MLGKLEVDRNQLFQFRP